MMGKTRLSGRLRLRYFFLGEAFFFADDDRFAVPLLAVFFLPNA